MIRFVLMNLREIKNLVAGTADAAYALDPAGMVIAWNEAASEMFGQVESDVLGKSCSVVLQGIDECGRECGENCSILNRVKNHQPVGNYDIKVRTGVSEKWCNASVVILDSSNYKEPCTLHIIRPADIQKRLELLVRDFIVAETTLPDVNIREIMTRKSSPTSQSDLTAREIEILRSLASGSTTAAISEKLFISPTTTKNHIQHIMKKLSAHTRLEAIRKAEQAGLI